MNSSRLRIIPAFLSVFCLLSPVLAQTQDNLRPPTQEEILIDILETVENTDVELSAFRKDVDERFQDTRENMNKGLDRIQDNMAAGFAQVNKGFDIVEDAARNEATGWAFKAFVPATIIGGLIGAAGMWVSQRRESK